MDDFNIEGSSRKQPQIEVVLPVGFLDPLRPEERLSFRQQLAVQNTVGNSALKDTSTSTAMQDQASTKPVIQSCKQLWKAGDYEGSNVSDSTNSHTVDLDQRDGTADGSAEGNFFSSTEEDAISLPDGSARGKLGSSDRYEIPEPDGSAEGNIDSSEEDANSYAKGNTDSSEGDAIKDPYVGMEFESEEAARNFYNEYARRVGFVVRIMQRRRSEIDGRTLARRLGCNKQGFSPNLKVSFGSDKKPRPSAREGCMATILVKMDKSGKWVVTRFVKEHNHPLVVTAHGFSTVGDKDKKIEELTLALQRQDHLCAAYREKLLKLLTNVEEQAEHLSSRVQEVLENVRKVEAEVKRSKA